VSGIEDLLAESALVRAPLGLLLGALAGSVAATLLIRWPDRRRPLAGRSRCDTCGKPLSISEMIPIVSFFALGARCRACRAPIEPRHIVLEMAAAALGMLALVAQPGWTGPATALLGWWLLLVAGLDFDRRWLPHRLTLPLVPLGLLVAVAGIGPPLVDRAIAVAAGLALWLLAFLYQRLRRRSLLYPGVAELVAGIGAWLGWKAGAGAIAAAALLGLLALLVARTRRGSGSPAGTLAIGALLALAAWPAWFVVAGF
jgi:leader peptidase (prepilin peptidase)/N-methyltransferase